jgi:hypothetical protein
MDVRLLTTGCGRRVAGGHTRGKIALQIGP